MNDLCAGYAEVRHSSGSDPCAAVGPFARPACQNERWYNLPVQEPGLAGAQPYTCAQTWANNMQHTACSALCLHTCAMTGLGHDTASRRNEHAPGKALFG